GDNPPPRVKMTTSPRRDKQEKQLLQWALKDDKPVLGICRGMQLLNVVLGGDLYHDIESELKSDINHTLGIDKKDVRHLVHSITLAPDSQLAAILGKHEVPTNSLHHQAIRELGQDLVVTARSADGVIEAVELPGKRFIIGVQSHPEVLEDGPWSKLFEAFVRSAA
ncbi:MAG TPA: gamma-glutamyl-gamma-aminobutyrate hydrolase family protein, partial [Candidatus Saccharimonadales bacterium]